MVTWVDWWGAFAFDLCLCSLRFGLVLMVVCLWFVMMGFAGLFA